LDEREERRDDQREPVRDHARQLLAVGETPKAQREQGTPPGGHVCTW
jgi:hypothetical protein